MHPTCNSIFTVMHLISMSPRLSPTLQRIHQPHPSQIAHSFAIQQCSNMVSSVADAEFGAVFVNAKEGTVTRTTLSEMGHEQDATDLKTDNSTADGIINNTVQQKRSKAMNIILLVKDRVEQDQFNVGWAPGDTNMGDYFTKHHSPAHHKRMRAYYLHDKHSPMIRNGTRLAIL
jgi:hypothetical protein